MKMKHLAAAAAAMGIVSAVAEELSIDRAFSVNGRMHVFVSAADWTNDVNDYALKSRAHGAEAWSDMGLGASNWWGPGGQPWGGQVCLTSAGNDCRGLMDFQLTCVSSGKTVEFTVDARNPLAGTLNSCSGVGGDNSVGNAFDSMINSYYLIRTDNDRWLSMEFDRKTYISRVSGIFNGGDLVIEVADKADFSDARTLFTLTSEESHHDNFHDRGIDQPIGGRYVRVRSVSGPWFSVWDVEFNEAIRITCEDEETKAPTITIDPWYTRSHGARLLRSSSADSGFEPVHTFGQEESVWTDTTLPATTGTYYYKIARIKEDSTIVDPSGDAVPYVLSADVPITRSFAINGRLYLFLDGFNDNLEGYLIEHQDPQTGAWAGYPVMIGNANSNVQNRPFGNAHCICGVNRDLCGVNNFRIAFDGAAAWTTFAVDARLPIAASGYHDSQYGPASNAADGLIDTYYLDHFGGGNMYPALMFDGAKRVATVAALVNNAAGAVFEGADDSEFTNPVVLRTLSADDCRSTALYTALLDVPAEVRYVRLRCANGEEWYSVWEFEVGEGMTVTRNNKDEKLPLVSIVAEYTKSGPAVLYRSTSPDSGYEAVHTFAQGETIWVDATCPELSTTYYYKVGESGIPVSFYYTFAPTVTRAIAFNGRLNVWIEDYVPVDGNGSSAYNVEYRLTPAGPWIPHGKFKNGSESQGTTHPFPQSFMSILSDFRGVVDFRLQLKADTRDWAYFTVDFGNPLVGTPETDFGDSLQAFQAMDGKVDTYYLAMTYNDRRDMRTGVDFGEMRTFSSIRWLPNGSHGTFEVSDDGVEYREIYELTGDDNVWNEVHELVLDQPVSARHFRYRAPAGGSEYFSVWEIEVDAAVSTENKDNESGCPTVVIARRFAEDYGAAIYRATQENGAYAKVGETAAGVYRWTDATLQPGDRCFYKVARLDENGQPGALSAESAKGERFMRLDRDPADETTLVRCTPVSDVAFDSNSLANIFDGNLATEGFAEGKNPSAGLDFGGHPVVMRRVRWYCTDREWWLYQRMRTLAVFGSNDENDPFGPNAVQISEALPNDLGDLGGFYREWCDMDCKTDVPYRYVFVRQVGETFASDPWRGQVAELQFYGWRKQSGLVVVVR